MQRFWVLLAVLYPLIAGYCFISTYGVRWESGPKYGMPATLVAADGEHFPNGEPLDLISRALVKTGAEEELWLAAIAFNTVAGTYLLRMQMAAKRMLEDVEKWNAAHGIPPSR